jgi:hypothetical protein
VTNQLDATVLVQTIRVEILDNSGASLGSVDGPSLDVLARSPSTPFEVAYDEPPGGEGAVCRVTFIDATGEVGRESAPIQVINAPEQPV